MLEVFGIICGVLLLVVFVAIVVAALAFIIKFAKWITIGAFTKWIVKQFIGKTTKKDK